MSICSSKYTFGNTSVGGAGGNSATGVAATAEVATGAEAAELSGALTGVTCAQALSKNGNHKKAVRSNFILDWPKKEIY